MDQHKLYWNTFPKLRKVFMKNFSSRRDQSCPLKQGDVPQNWYMLFLFTLNKFFSHLNRFGTLHTYLQGKTNQLWSSLDLFVYNAQVIWISCNSHWGTRVLFAWKSFFNPLTNSVPHYIETSQLICVANQLTGFYI